MAKNICAALAQHMVDVQTDKELESGRFPAKLEASRNKYWAWLDTLKSYDVDEEQGMNLAEEYVLAAREQGYVDGFKDGIMVMLEVMQGNKKGIKFMLEVMQEGKS